MEITNNHIKFFKQTFNVDVSNVKVLFYSDNDSVGEYRHNMPGCIYLNRERLSHMHILNTDLTITHELTHLVQYEHNMAISLDLRTLPAHVVHKMSLCLEWGNSPLEIDAMLTEAYYLFFINKDMPNIDRAITDYLIGKLNRKTNNNLSMCVKNLCSASHVYASYKNIVTNAFYPNKKKYIA